jgi:hypothetical protein
MIKIAAIKFTKNNKEITIKGTRHCDCYEILFKQYHIPYMSTNYNIIEGFVTSDGIFLDRYEAYLIAKENNQIISDTNGPLLYSEDIY